MNSCILTSSDIKRNLFLSLLLVVFSFVTIDMFLVFYANFKTTKNSFLEEKSSKIKHFELNKKLNRDIVFIGSSRTVYHVSTNRFKQYGFDIYNFGVSGNYLVDYPAYVNKAIKQKPKNIIISLRLSALFEEIEEAKKPFWDDVVFYKNLDDKSLFFNSLYYWVRNRHSFLSYSEPIAVKIKLLYDKFEPQEYGSISKDNSTEHSLEQNDYDCKVFSKQKINANKTILKCTNGDGMLLGSILKDAPKVILDKINHNSFSILKNLVDIIRSNHIRPIIVFEPTFNKHYINNKTYVENYLDGIPYVDLTNLLIENQHWADNSHLNISGRKIYSDYLAQYFKKEWKK